MEPRGDGGCFSGEVRDGVRERALLGGVARAAGLPKLLVFWRYTGRSGARADWARREARRGGRRPSIILRR
eukprot:2996817-Pleurochrysis_carterae.AAC.1